MLLKGKNAIITGCARGIGRQTLQLFAENGANVWACCRSRTDEFEVLCRDLAEANHVNIVPTYFNLSDGTKMKEAVKAVMAAKLPVDALVNNAGITYNALFQMTSMDRMREVFEVNFFSQVAFTQYVAKLMVRQKSGSIINVSSTAALDANPGRGAYGASKAAIITMTRAMAHELSEHNVRCNVIAPGITDTDMASASMTPAVIDAAVQKTHLKRIGQPLDLARAALFLASDLSSYVTGQVLRVDGGLHN